MERDILNSRIHLPLGLIVIHVLFSVEVKGQPTHGQGAGCRPISDVIFIVDGSDSMSQDEFSQQQMLMERFVSLTDISSDTVRVGITVVSSTIGDKVTLMARDNRTSLMTAIKSLSQPMEGSRLDMGLVEMEQMFGSFGRPGVVRVGVMMTDGRAKFERATIGEANVVKNAGVFLVTIGVGRLIQFHNLETIASTRSNAYPILPLDISAKLLAETVNFLGQETCSGHALLDQLTTARPPHTDHTAGTISPTTPPTMAALRKQESIAIDFNKIPGSQMDVFVPPQSAINPLLHQDQLLQMQEIFPKRALYEASSFNIPTVDMPSFGSISADSIRSPLDKHSANFTRISVELTKDAAQNHQSKILVVPNPAPLVAPPTTSTTTTTPAPPTGHAIVMPQQVHVDMSQKLNGVANMAATVLDQQHIDPNAANDLYNVFNMNSFSFAGSPPPAFVNSVPSEAMSNLNIKQDPTIPQQTLTDIRTIGSGNFLQANDPQQQSSPMFTPKNTAITSAFKSAVSAVSRNKSPVTISDQPLDGPAISLSTAIDAANAAANVANAVAADVGVQSAIDIAQQSMIANLLNKQAMNRAKESGISFAPSPPSPTPTATTLVPGGTTPSPYIDGIHRELAAHQCSQARNIDGVGYTFHPKSCTEFLQCFQTDNGKLHVEVGKCPFETFFDEELSVCRYHTQVKCYRDPCKDTDVISYKHSENCRAYWDCTMGKSAPKCCPFGSSYSPGYGCVRNNTCKDMCMDYGNLIVVVAASKCKQLQMDSNPKYYFESVAGVGWVVRTCPYGSRFDQAECNCKTVTEVSAMTNNCKPELYLDFNGAVADRSGNGLSLGNSNVQLETGMGVFDGASLLKVWRFSGVSFGQKVTISFRFRLSVTAPKGKLMHILSNCCYGCNALPSPSLDIAVIPGFDGGIGVISATTETAGEVFVYIPYEDTITGWNTLSYSYNGRELSGEINGARGSKQIIGDIVARSDPLTIGACNMNNAYQGYLDEMKFYLCNL